MHSAVVKYIVSSLKSITPKNIHAWIIILASINIAYLLFYYAVSLPPLLRIRGDAYQYLNIANSFASIHDAITYVGDRTYGFPLFLYLIKIIFSPTNANDWATKASYIQFSIHILASLCFYKFFLQNIFKQVKLSNIFAALVCGVIICYPTVVANTSIQLVDTLGLDLLLFVVVLYKASFIFQRRIITFIIAGFCGLLLGYTIMVMPLLWPPAIILYIVSIVEKFGSSFKHPNRIVIFISMTIGVLTPILPTMHQIWSKDHTVGIQNTKYLEYYTKSGFQNGLSNVRVFWSTRNPSNKIHPGIYDPYLTKIYGETCKADSPISVIKCLFSRPLAIPIYFTKKIIAIFDVPYLQSYTVDMTPTWFIPWERLFGMFSFSGFMYLILNTIARPFLKLKVDWLGWNWSFFAIFWIGMITFLPIEGRHGFVAIPFAIASLFLSFATMRQLGAKFIVAWIYILSISCCLFLYQTYLWDLVPPS